MAGCRRIQPDGTVVVAGNILGSEFELATPVKVIGTDLPAVPAKRVPKMTGGKDGRQETDKKTGEPLWEKPSWKHDGTTGFVARLSGDLKKVLSVSRMPWNCGAITSAAIGSDGCIYIAGRAGDKISALSDKIEDRKGSEKLKVES